jgi:hypothetical protein
MLLQSQTVQERRGQWAKHHSFLRHRSSREPALLLQPQARQPGLPQPRHCSEARRPRRSQLPNGLYHLLRQLQVHQIEFRDEQQQDLPSRCYQQLQEQGPLQGPHQLLPLADQQQVADALQCC